MKILIKYPSRQRPEIFKQRMKEYQELLSGEHEVIFLISCDEDDATMNNAKIKKFIKAYDNTQVFFNKQPQTKISAINANINEVKEWDIILVISDDMLPKVQGFDKIIADKFTELYPNGNGVIWLNDGYRGKNSQYPLCTIPLMGRFYYDRFGYVYHPEYISLWADNEFHDVARKFGRMTYVHEVIIEHILPSNVKETEYDELYQRNDKFFYSDKDIYNRHKLNRFQ